MNIARRISPNWWRAGEYDTYRGMRLPRYVVVLAALLVAACQSGGEDPAAQGGPPPTCQIARAVDLPARLVEGHILVPAAINDIPVQLEVDPGTMKTMLTPEGVARLNLHTDPLRTTTIHGVGGTAVTYNSSIQSLRLGDKEWMWSVMPTARLPTTYHEEPPVVGVLGADRLSEFDVELDLPRQRMTLWSVTNCQGDFVPWQAPHAALPLARYPPRRMVTPVSIDGHPVMALIEWGSPATTLTTAAAERIGVSAAAMDQDKSGFSRGVDQNLIPFIQHRFDELAIGPFRFHHVILLVAPLEVRNADMLLGANFFSRRHVWLSYATEQLFVQRGPDAAEP